MKSQKGQGLVEFLLVIPTLLGLILLIVDGGFLFWVRVSSQNAAAEVGRAVQVWGPNVQGVTCLQDALAAADRVTTFDYTLQLSDNCALAGSLTRIPARAPINVKLIVDWTPVMSMIFFRTPPVIHLPVDITVEHE